MDKDAAILITGADDNRKELLQQWLDSNESTSVDFAGTSAGERGIDREEGFVSQFYSTCLRGFQRLCRQERNKYARGSRFYLLKEELDKLYMWGESFGPGELDKSLDDSEELRDNVLDLLVNLGELLICESQASSTVARHGQIHELESIIKQAKLIMSDVDGQVDLDTLASNATCPDRDVYSDDNVPDFCEDVVFIVKCLMELGPSLEQNLVSAGRSVLPVSTSASVLFCLSGPAEFYVSLVRDKFKKASRELVERLGEANWQRHLKVRNKFKDTENDPAKGQATARSVFEPDMTFNDSGIGTSVLAGTQYAPSDTSFRSSNTEGALRSLRVPPTPIEATNGKSFRCRYCGDMVSTVRTRTQWKMHVFGDLMPYICTFDGCPQKLRCFPSRSSWAHHEFEEHRFDRYWACPECPRRSCSTLDWEHHLQYAHNQKFAGHNLVSARNNACRISPKRAEDEQCPLCLEVPGNPRRAFVKHVCRHMEDIALMALPSHAEEDLEIGSISTNHISNEGNDNSKYLHIDGEYTIKCICGFKDDDGNTLYCERCDTWQHTQCYYLDEGGIVPTKDVLSSIDHICADCKPRPLDARGAVKRQVNRRAHTGSNALWMQPSQQQLNAPPEKQTARITSPYDTSDGLIRESPQVERTLVNVQPSLAPDQLPPPERSPTPEGMSRLPISKRRTRRPKAQASHGDAELIGIMGGLNHPDLASKAGEEPLLQESEESTDEDDEEPTNRESSETTQAPRKKAFIVESSDTGSDDQHGISNNEQSESGNDAINLLRTTVPNLKSGRSLKEDRYEAMISYSEGLSFVNPCGEQVGVSDWRPKTREPAYMYRSRRMKRRFTTAEKERIALTRRVGACNDCRRAKRKCTHFEIPVDGDPQGLGPQGPVQETETHRRRFNPAKGEEVERRRPIGVCNDCRRLRRKCSMSHVGPREPLPSTTLSMVSVDNHLSSDYQMHEWTPTAMFNFGQPPDMTPPQHLSSKGIRSNQPAVREPETGVQTNQLTAEQEEAIKTLAGCDGANVRRFLQEAGREKPATSSKEIADPYDHSDDGPLGRDDPPTENSACKPRVR